METIRSNFMNLALKQKLIGAHIIFYDEELKSNMTKIVSDFEYDSMTHEFMIKFIGGDDVRPFSDKFKFDVNIDGVNRLNPNKKRGKQKY